MYKDDSINRDDTEYVEPYDPDYDYSEPEESKTNFESDDYDEY